MKTMRQRGLMFRIVVLVMVLSLFPLSFPASADNIIENSPAGLEERDESAARATIRYESEPNDTEETSNHIDDDDTTYGRISSLFDEDYYRVVFESDGLANFWLGNIPSGMDYDLYLYSSDGTLLDASTTDNVERAQEFIGNFPVVANTIYYMQVVGYHGYDTLTYYQLRAKKVTRYEAESNNTEPTADELYNGDTMYGKIGTNGDVDYYRIRFSRSGKANFWLGDIPSGKDYDLYVYDSYGDLLGSSTSNNSQRAQELVTLDSIEANTWYYVKVVGCSCYDASTYYKLRVRHYSERSLRVLYDYTCALSEAEMNADVADGIASIASRFGIEFNRISTTESSQLQGANCPNSQYTQICNANCGNTTMCKQTHHKGPWLLEVDDSSTVYTYRLVGHMVCFYDSEDGMHSHVLGFGDCPGLDSLTSSYSSQQLDRSIQHELTHNLGASHNCNKDQQCVLKGQMNNWCDNCSNAIATRENS